jgi:hypothetical protein
MTTKSTKKIRTARVVTEKGLLTPYAAAKFVNAELEAANLSKRIPPQMMYNYTTARANAGKPTLIGFDNDRGEVELESLKEWTTKYVAKQKAIAEAADAAE